MKILLAILFLIIFSTVGSAQTSLLEVMYGNWNLDRLNTRTAEAVYGAPDIIFSDSLYQMTIDKDSIEVVYITGTKRQSAKAKYEYRVDSTKYNGDSYLHIFLSENKFPVWMKGSGIKQNKDYLISQLNNISFVLTDVSIEEKVSREIVTYSHYTFSRKFDTVNVDDVKVFIGKWYSSNSSEYYFHDNDTIVLQKNTCCLKGENETYTTTVNFELHNKHLFLDYKVSREYEQAYAHPLSGYIPYQIKYLNQKLVFTDGFNNYVYSYRLDGDRLILIKE